MKIAISWSVGLIYRLDFCLYTLILWVKDFNENNNKCIGLLSSDSHLEFQNGHQKYGFSPYFCLRDSYIHILVSISIFYQPRNSISIIIIELSYLVQAAIFNFQNRISCRVNSLRNRLLRTPDMKGLLGFGHPRNTACGCVHDFRIIAINVSD